MYKALGIITTFLIIVALLFGFFFWFIFGGSNHFIEIPKPKTTYGEFPFCLTYELNGETIMIEDVIICEFVGLTVVGEAGKYRQWDSSLKSGKELITLLDLRELEDEDALGNHVLELYFYWGNAEYYMGDNLANRWRQEQDFNWIDYMYQKTDGTIGHSAYKADIAWEKYKIKLISWEVSPPIQNSFK